MKVKRFSLREISIGLVVLYAIICALGVYCRYLANNREIQLARQNNELHVVEDFYKQNRRGIFLPHRSDGIIHILPTGYFGIFILSPKIREFEGSAQSTFPSVGSNVYPRYSLQYKPQLVKIFRIPIPSILSSPTNFPGDDPEAYLREWEKDAIYYLAHQAGTLQYLGTICFTVLGVISACAFLAKALLTNPAKANAANLLGYVMAVMATSFFIETMALGPVIIGSNPAHTDTCIALARWIYVIPAWDVVMRQVKYYHIRRFRASQRVTESLHEAIATYEGVSYRVPQKAKDTPVKSSKLWIPRICRFFLYNNDDDLLDEDIVVDEAGGTTRTPDVSIAALLRSLSRITTLWTLRHMTVRTACIIVTLRICSQMLNFGCDPLISVLDTQRQIDLRVLQQHEVFQRQLSEACGRRHDPHSNASKHRHISMYVLQNLKRAHKRMKSRKQTSHAVRVTLVYLLALYLFITFAEMITPGASAPYYSVLFACARMFMEMLLESSSMTIVLFLATMFHNEEMETSEALSLTATLLEMQDSESKAKRERARAEAKSSAARRKLLAWVMHEIRGPANIIQLGLDDLENKITDKLEELGDTHGLGVTSPSPRAILYKTTDGPVGTSDVITPTDTVDTVDSDPQSYQYTFDTSLSSFKGHRGQEGDDEVQDKEDCDPPSAAHERNNIGFVDEAILAVQLLRTSVESIVSVMDSTLTMGSSSQDADQNGYKFKCDIVPNNLPSMFRSVAMTLTPLILKMGASLRVTIDSHFLTGPLLYFDSNRVAQVLRNFVLNAMKWIPKNQKGKIELQVMLDDVLFIEDTQNWRMKTGCHVQGRVSIVHPLHVHDCPRKVNKKKRGLVEVWIVRLNCIDNGVGIPAEDMKHLFKPYSQVRSGETLPEISTESTMSPQATDSSSQPNTLSYTDTTVTVPSGEDQTTFANIQEDEGLDQLDEDLVSDHVTPQGDSAFDIQDRNVGTATTKGSPLPHTTPQNTQVKHSKGTGLGLVISKGIAEEHGGYVSAASQIGKGSIFSCTLPLRANRPSRKSSTEQTDMPPPIRIFAPAGEIKQTHAAPNDTGDISSSSLYPSTGSTTLTFAISATGSSKGVSETKLEGSGYGHFSRRDTSTAVSPRDLFTLKAEDLPLRFLLMTLRREYQSALIARLKMHFRYSRFVIAKSTKEIINFVDCTHVVSKMEKIMCDNPTLQLLHPVYHPFDVIILEIDGKKLDDAMNCIRIVREESNWSPQSQGSLDRSIPFAMPLKVFLIGIYEGGIAQIGNFEEIRYLDALIPISAGKDAIYSAISNSIREHSTGNVVQ